MRVSSHRNDCIAQHRPAPLQRSLTRAYPHMVSGAATERCGHRRRGCACHASRAGVGSAAGACPPSLLTPVTHPPPPTSAVARGGPTTRDRLRSVARAVFGLQPRVVRVSRRARRGGADPYPTRCNTPNSSRVVASVRFRRSPPTSPARRSRFRLPVPSQALLPSYAGIGGARALLGSSVPALGAQQARTPLLYSPPLPTLHHSPSSAPGRSIAR